MPRADHAKFEPPASRADPVALLERQAKTRVPELVPIRYGRMLVSPFTFYRGAALIMANDLASTPRSGLNVQCCGDAHLSNFGVFASPERRLMFDVNDFDETLPGPWEWDVKRLAVSMLIAARDNGFRAKEQEPIVLDTVGSYRTGSRRGRAPHRLLTPRGASKAVPRPCCPRKAGRRRGRQEAFRCTEAGTVGIGLLVLLSRRAAAGQRPCHCFAPDATSRGAPVGWEARA